jgi:hypothetical protein
MYYLLLFPGNSGFVNAPQCYVMLCCLSCSFFPSWKVNTLCVCVCVSHFHFGTTRQTFMSVGVTREPSYNTFLFRTGSSNEISGNPSSTLRLIVSFQASISMKVFSITLNQDPIDEMQCKCIAFRYDKVHPQVADGWDCLWMWMWMWRTCESASNWLDHAEKSV